MPDSVTSQVRTARSWRQSADGVSHIRQAMSTSNQKSHSASTTVSESGGLSIAPDDLTPEVLYEMLLTRKVPEGLLYTV